MLGLTSASDNCTNASLLNVEKMRFRLRTEQKEIEEAAKTEIAPDAIGLFFVLSEDC